MSKLRIPNDTGGWTEVELDSQGQYKVQEKEDVTALLKQNEQERNHVGEQYMGGKGTQSTAKKIGSISPVTMMNLIEQGIFWDDKALLKWFDDLDNYLWRTTAKSSRNS